MGVERIVWASSSRRGGPALVAALVMAVLTAGGGQAAAAARSGDAGAPRGGPDAGVISTVAGGVGGPARATTVALPTPCGVSLGGGRLYIADGGSVRAVSPGTDRLTTPAGTGVGGPFADGGRATRANLSSCGVTVDAAGNLLIADNGDNRVRVVAHETGTFYGQAMTAGHIYTVAGGGTGDLGDGGPATSAALFEPSGVAVDAAGNLAIADNGDNRVRVVAARSGTFYGQAMTAGDIYTVAGDGTAGFAGDGGPASGAELNSPDSVAVDAAGNLAITDSSNDRVRVVAARSGTFYGQAMTAGHIYTVAGDGTFGFSGDGGPATSAELAGPESVAVDAAGNLAIADNGDNRVRVVAARSGTFYGQAMTAGDIYTVAGGGTGGLGDGGPATSAKLFEPSGVAVDAAGNLLIADMANRRVRAVAVTTGTFYGQAMTAGDIYTVAGNGMVAFSGDGGPATSAEFWAPEGTGVDAAGNLLIADTQNNRIRVAAATTGTFYGRAMTAGDIYTVAGNGHGKQGNPPGDGGPATSAELFQPYGVAVDAARNLLIADASHQRIRVVAASTGTFYGQAMTAGDIYTVAGDGSRGFSGDGGPAAKAELNFPSEVAVDAAGNLVIADTHNNRIRVAAASTGTFYGRAMTAGDIYTVAGNGTQGFSGDGGPATNAEFNGLAGVAVGVAGNLVIADTQNNRIRVAAASTGTFYGQAMTAGDIYTVAGNGTSGFAGDRGPAAKAELNFPGGVAVNSAGNLVIADTQNNRVRVVAARGGTFYGQAMTAGDIYTVAGGGTGSFGGGGPATKTELSGPTQVAVNSAGDLLITDFGRILKVTG